MIRKNINKVILFVASDDSGEGIMAVKSMDGSWIPLVGADEERVKSMFPIAQALSKKSKTIMKVIEMSKRKDITNEVERKYGSRAVLTKRGLNESKRDKKNIKA